MHSEVKWQGKKKKSQKTNLCHDNEVFNFNICLGTAKIVKNVLCRRMLGGRVFWSDPKFSGWAGQGHSGLVLVARRGFVFTCAFYAYSLTVCWTRMGHHMARPLSPWRGTDTQNWMFDALVTPKNCPGHMMSPRWYCHCLPKCAPGTLKFFYDIPLS